MQKIGRLVVRKRGKSIPPAYHTPQNRPPGVRTPNSKSLTEALIRISTTLAAYGLIRRALGLPGGFSGW